MQKTDALIFTALQDFAAEVTRKTKALAAGEPEDQLRAPFEKLMGAVGQALGQRVVAKGESRLPGRLGKTDYAIHARQLFTGYAELKRPGKGADPSRYKGHDKQQWKRFQAQPNIIYTDGNEWGLYRDANGSANWWPYQPISQRRVKRRSSPRMWARSSHCSPTFSRGSQSFQETPSNWPRCWHQSA